MRTTTCRFATIVRVSPVRPITSDEIRETFLRFFEEHGSRRLASASLVPAQHDPSVMLTTAGMHPLKPYFLGADTPPATRLTSCQKCFRTPDIDNVGVTARHLTFFEMLGNFSIGDYFKREAIAYAWELTTKGFGFDPEKVWVTVFGGDDELGLGPDVESIEFWLEVGVPRERIVELGREDNFWQAGPTGPCGPCTELYLDRGPDYGPATAPGQDESDRFMEFWNLVLMQYDQSADDDGKPVLTPLPTNNIDTGMGLNRMAMLLQDKQTIFETDQFAPLIALGEQLSGKRYESGDEAFDRALRILADHTRGMTFLISDGVVPSNEDRGYVLRRLMRRAVVQGQQIGIEGEFLGRFLDVVVETMGDAYPEIRERREEIRTWVLAEEEGFGRTLQQGLGVLETFLAAGPLSGAQAFQLHDTFGFPIDLTLELYEERSQAAGDGADWTAPDSLREEFDRLMGAQRERSKAGSRRGDHGGAAAGSIAALVADEPSEFTGYSSLDQHTTVAGILEREGKTYLKLAESPFYPEGGGQVSDSGTITLEDGSEQAAVTAIVRAGDDQAIVVEPVAAVGDGNNVHGVALKAGQRVVARVDRHARHATECNHTATHLLHAALRERLGDHVHQAGSAVRPDKLRFDFSHPTKLTAEDVQWVEDRVNEGILANDRVRALTMPIDEAKALGAMALFGEKYGDVVRMVEIGDGSFSRELCGGTHVRSTAEIGVFKITSEGSSSANVRRIEAITGPVAVELLRRHDRLLEEAAVAAKVHVDQVPERIVKLRDQAKGGGGARKLPAVDEQALAAEATDIAGVPVVISRIEGVDPKDLPAIADRVKGKLAGPGVVVLAAPGDERVALIVAVGPEIVERGVKAGDVIKAAAAVVGGGGGGKPTMAQAGGKQPEHTDDALRAARETIANALGA